MQKLHWKTRNLWWEYLYWTFVLIFLHLSIIFVNIFSQDTKNEKYVNRNYINKIFLTQLIVFYFFKLLDNSCSYQFPCIHRDKNIEGVIKQEISKWQNSNQKMQSIYIHIIEYRFKKFWSDTLVYREGFRDTNICLSAQVMCWI